ncbi:hypothetical protein LP123_02895 [Moraxella bovis]|uniref:Uncharacterized protein n=1 Tax=Moraxella bovis TaxID=476 RepID=A0AAQ2Q8A9_MORBO|nr:hypothetical protein [Moraxella bovis]AWY19551.1 hypothetical protein DQF64_02855 [Moraxella bovis]UYZ75329.1 hypothetical protein LP093_11355 [Moraxella bovis]UYZ78738.1 hypothetical protein LP115_02505 [Moraxella bovis]UYZ81704.1 hypothetical protein LP113_02915 [Moraxella bovis]UYZ87220.1 hypothetical protein LP094_02505 [Moraxella bovis]
MTNKRTKLNKSDLKIYPSERLTDNDDGGGLALGTPLTGADNELFDPISSIQRINGGMMTRLVYAGVQRADDEPLLGAFTAAVICKCELPCHLPKETGRMCGKTPALATSH